MQESTLARMKMSDVWSLMEWMNDGYLERGSPWLSWSNPVYVTFFSKMLMPDPQMSIDRILSVVMKFLIYVVADIWESACGVYMWGNYFSYHLRTRHHRSSIYIRIVNESVFLVDLTSPPASSDLSYPFLYVSKPQ